MFCKKKVYMVCPYQYKSLLRKFRQILLKEWILFMILINKIIKGRLCLIICMYMHT